jgi:endonuclease-8
MPEGNELHRWAKMHNEIFGGKKVHVEGPQGRFTDAPLLDGRVLRRVIAVGKHLGYDFGKDRMLHVHMGLYGDFTEGKGALPEVRGALRLRMSTAKDWVELRGPTDCSLYSEEQWQALLARIGPDPLGPDPKGHDAPDAVYAAILKRKTPVGALLMDQTVIGGIGNIYRAEFLFRAGVHPWTPGSATTQKQLQEIWRDAKMLMPEGMVDRRMVTTKPKDRPHARGGALDEECHYVYRRHGRPCFVCGTKILRKEMAGRTVYWCPGCQPEMERPNDCI